MAVLHDDDSVLVEGGDIARAIRGYNTKTLYTRTIWQTLSRRTQRLGRNTLLARKHMLAMLLIE